MIIVFSQWSKQINVDVLCHDTTQDLSIDFLGTTPALLLMQVLVLFIHWLEGDQKMTFYYTLIPRK